MEIKGNLPKMKLFKDMGIGCMFADVKGDLFVKYRNDGGSIIVENAVSISDGSKVYMCDDHRFFEVKGIEVTFCE